MTTGSGEPEEEKVPSGNKIQIISKSTYTDA